MAIPSLAGRGGDAGAIRRTRPIPPTDWSRRLPLQAQKGEKRGVGRAFSICSFPPALPPLLHYAGLRQPGRGRPLPGRWAVPNVERPRKLQPSPPSPLRDRATCDRAQARQQGNRRKRIEKHVTDHLCTRKKWKTSSPRPPLTRPTTSAAPAPSTGGGRRHLHQ